MKRLHPEKKHRSGKTPAMVAFLKKRISHLEEAEKERDKALESLRLTEKMFSRILTFSPDSIIISSMADGRYINVNDSFLDAVGFKREELVGKTSIKLSIWDDPSERSAFVETLLANGYVKNFEAKFRKKNGTVGIVLMSSEMVDVDGERCLITLSKDITDRKKAEVALRESEQRLRTIFETSPDAIIITGTESGDILEYNQVFLDISGYTRDEIESGRIRLTDRLFDMNEYRYLSERLASEGFVRNFEFQFSKCDGTLKTGLISARMITINSSACVLSVIKDIDDLKMVRIEIERQKAKLAESNEKLEKLSMQTEQFSLAAASMITMRDEEAFFDRISRAIVDYSDFNRVMIFFFKDTFPYRDIIGHHGFSEEEIIKTVRLEAKKDRFTNVFEKGRKVGQFSFHINSADLPTEYPGLTMPGNAPCNSVYPGLSGWQRNDCLFVQLTDQKRNLAGFICVDGSKSGAMPTDEMVRPLEIFASLVAQIIMSRKIHEERIKSEIKYRTILEKIDDPYFELDFEGGYSFYNTALNRVLGYSDIELLDSNIRDHLFDASVFSEIMSLKAPRTIQYEIVRKDGTIVPVETHFSLVEDALGVPVGFRGISRDISMHRKVEAELTKARNTAEATGLAQRSFLANISHEIRTPLSGVIGMCKLMKDTDLTSEQQEYINSLNESADFLMNVINDVLDFSKLQAGQFTFEHNEFSLYDIVNRSVIILKNQAMQKGLEIHISISPHIPDRIYGDSARISQILVNLVGNAIKFTETGRIDISAVTADTAGDEMILRFNIKDTGIGVPFEKMNRLFRPFSQVDESLTRHYRGTGLGLAISRQLAELMGGSIGVKSNPDKGSTFWFTVKVTVGADTVHSVPEKPVPGRSGQPDVSAFPSDGGSRVLIVEDNEINQLLIKKYMDKLGFASHSVKNGREAVEILMTQVFDLVLMDLQMPEMSGIDATSAIRNPRSGVLNSQIPIIAVTAHAMKEDREKCLEVGMNDYISKPLTLQSVKDVIHKYMPGN